jgi:hypothetical protein
MGLFDNAGCILLGVIGGTAIFIVAKVVKGFKSKDHARTVTMVDDGEDDDCDCPIIGPKLE